MAIPEFIIPDFPVACRIILALWDDKALLEQAQVLIPRTKSRQV